MESKLTHGYRGRNLLMLLFMSFFVHFLHENEKSESGKSTKKRERKRNKWKWTKIKVKTKDKLKSEIGIQTSSRIEGLDPPRELFHIKCHAFDKCGSTYQYNLHVNENSNIILTWDYPNQKRESCQAKDNILVFQKKLCAFFNLTCSNNLQSLHLTSQLPTWDATIYQYNLLPIYTCSW